MVLDLHIDSDVFDPSVLSYNRERLERHDIIGVFFDSIVRQAVADKRVSEHFSVDGTLIEPYGSIKQFVPIESTADAATAVDGDAPATGGAQPPAAVPGAAETAAAQAGAGSDGASGGGASGVPDASAQAVAEPDATSRNPFKSRNAQVDFRGRKRRNNTHTCRTDPDAKLARKSDGQPSRLSHIVQNRNGLVLAVDVRSPLDNGEAAAVPDMVDAIARRHGIKPATLGADRGYDRPAACAGVAQRGGPRGRRVRPDRPSQRRGQREQSSMPEEACGADRGASAQSRPQRVDGLRAEPALPKAEESLSYLKCVAGLRRSSLSGHWKTRQLTVVAASA